MFWVKSLQNSSIASWDNVFNSQNVLIDGWWFYWLQDSMELQHKQSKAVAVTCFSFLSGDVNNFVVGSEDCTVYTACRHGGWVGKSP